MAPLDDNEENPTRLWAEIWKLRNEAKGPDGFDTWRDAAIDEKMKRKLEEVRTKKVMQELAELKQRIRDLLV